MSNGNADRPIHILGSEAEHSSQSVKVAATADVREIIPGGSSIHRRVLFGEDLWTLAGHDSWRAKAGGKTNLDFTGVPARWRTAAKEWVLLCINPSLGLEWAPDDPTAQTWPMSQEPVKLVTAQGNLKALRLALQVLDRYNLIEPDADGWARVATLMRQPVDRSDKLEHATLSSGTLRGRIQQLRSLWSIRTIVDRPMLLGEEPLGDEETTALFGSGARPKRNLRRPHEDVGVCLGFIAWVFDNIAEDVLDHLRWWSANSGSSDTAPGTRDEGYQSMVALLHEVVSEHGVLPATLNMNKNPTLAHTALARMLGLYDPDEAYLWGRYAMRRFTDTPLDLEGGNPCPIPISELPLADGGGSVTWIARLLYTNDELQWWASALVYYAMFYVAATCGLRDLDLDCLPKSCVSTATQVRPNGETYVANTVRGYKQKNRIAPLPTEWKVSGRVARILHLVDEMHSIYGIKAGINGYTGEPRLFDPQLITASNRGMRESIHLDLSYMNWLTTGAKRLQERGVIARNLDNVSRLTVSQIRITTLQSYASRPLGNALVAQFGQWSGQGVAMGYHSDIFKLIHLADPVDAQEVTYEDTGRTLVHVARHADRLGGNGVPAMKVILEGNREVLTNPGPLSSSRLRSLGKKYHNVVTGPYTVCIFRPDQALCGGQGAADFRLCRPYECRNSVMTVGQRAKVEIRRRQGMAMAPILARDAKKIATGMPEVVEEFAGVTDEDLVRLATEEMETYLRDALRETGEEL